MVKGIIENIHIISLKITKFIWFLGYYNFSKMDMYFKTEGVSFYLFYASCFWLTAPRVGLLCSYFNKG